MDFGRRIAAAAGGGLLFGAFVAAFMAVMIDCQVSFDAVEDAACAATKWQAWQLVVLPAALGLVLLSTALTYSPEQPSTPPGP